MRQSRCPRCREELTLPPPAAEKVVIRCPGCKAAIAIPPRPSATPTEGEAPTPSAEAPAGYQLAAEPPRPAKAPRQRSASTEPEKVEKVEKPEKVEKTELPEDAGDDTDAPTYFDAFYKDGSKLRNCRICRVGVDLLLLDIGPHVADAQVGARMGAATGGLIGALLGMAADALIKKARQGQEQDAQRRLRALDKMSPEELSREAAKDDRNRRWPVAKVTRSELRPGSWWKDPTDILAVLHLDATTGAKAENRKLFFDRQTELKAAAGLLRAALGEERVGVSVPITKKAVARAEAKRKRTARFVGFGLLGAMVLIIGLGLLLSRGKKGGGAATEEDAKFDFAVVTTSTVVPDPKKAPPPPESALTPAAPADEPLPPIPAPAAVEPPPAPDQARAAAAALPPDPRPTAPEPWSESLVLKAAPDFPWLADQGGPFAIVPNTPAMPILTTAQDDPKFPGRRVVTLTILDPRLKATEPPPLGLLDLRTGQQTGGFSWKARCTPGQEGRLAPDGATLAVPANFNIYAPECILDFWKRDAAEAAGTIRLGPGRVQWLEFLSPTLLAALVVGTETSLEVWDVATLKRLHNVPVRQAPPKDPTPVNLHPNYAAPEQLYAPTPLYGAASGGGRYVALGSAADVVVIDTREGREVARFPVPDNAGRYAYSALGFIPETHQLAAVLKLKSLEHWLLVWDLATGREKARNAIRALVPGTVAFYHGRFLAGPAPELLIVTGHHPRFPDITGHILEATTGIVAQKLDFALLGPPRNGKVPAFAPLFVANKVRGKGGAGEKSGGQPIVFPTRWDPAALGEAFAASAKYLGRRPPVTLGDRSGVPLAEPKPPAAWAAPPAGSWEKPPDVALTLPGRPSDVVGNVAICLRYVPHEQPVVRNELVCERYDLATGQRLGELQSLWPWLLHPYEDPEVQRTRKIATSRPTPPAALSADGSRLAVADPGRRNRVDLWNDKGERQGGFLVGGDKQLIDWLGWSADGKLLTLAGGTLLAWDVTTNKLTWAVHGGYSEMATLARGRKWGAFAGPKRVDLIDVTTGQCLSRCQAKGLPTSFRELHLAPDDRRLLAVAAASGGKEQFTGWVWDLANGSAETFGWSHRWHPHLHGAGWLGPEQVVLSSIEPGIIDLRAKGLVVVGAQNARDARPIATLPDGRLLLAPPRGTSGGCRSFVMAEHADLLLDPERRIVDLRKAAVSAEADLGNATMSKSAAQKMADELAGRGVTIGAGGWRFRLHHDVQDSNNSLSGAFGREVRIPKVVFTWDLISPEGAKAWSYTESQGPGGKYLKRSRPDPGNPMGTVHEYELPAGDARQAFVEEIMEYKLSQLTVPPMPLWALTAGGKSMPLPLVAKWQMR